MASHVIPPYRIPIACSRSLSGTTRYTPEMVQQVCGIPKELFFKVANALVENSGRERTTTWCYAVGWTQHTVGVQIIRAASVLQLLLGNIGRPGGGILPLRGHATIQGSTDIPTLYDMLPGYLGQPHIKQPHERLDDYIKSEYSPTGWWFNFPKYIVSLLKAWYGDRAQADNDFCFDHLPRISGDHSQMPMTMAIHDGQIKGFFLMGQNPAVGSATPVCPPGLANLDWMVVRDPYEHETASFWYASPRSSAASLIPLRSKRRSFSCPRSWPERRMAASQTPIGWCSGTTRL